MWKLPLPGFDSTERKSLSLAQVRQLARLGTLIRWPGLIFGAIVGLVVPPRTTILLVGLLLWVALYNGWAMAALPRIADRSVLRLGRALTLLDMLSYFWLLAIFPQIPAAAYAAFMLLILWMVAYDGAEGALLALTVFVIGMIGLQVFRGGVYRAAFDGTSLLLWSLIMGFGASVMAAFDRIVLATPEAAPGPLPESASITPVAIESGNGSQVRLSRREQEVLRLVADGCSNSMIAARLHLSENTVKTYVETLLTRLNARNRAEAVAAASKQHLI
jgi:DNA-binding CsgD family transcriptional regulator